MRALTLPVVMLAMIGFGVADRAAAHQDCDDDATAIYQSADDDDDTTASYSTADYQEEADDDTTVGSIGSDNGYDGYNGYNGNDGYDGYGGDRRGSGDIRARVQQALWRDLGQDAGSIRIAVTGDSVYLSGWVPNRNEHDRAHDIAHQVPGVAHVYHDQLYVQSQRNRYGG